MRIFLTRVFVLSLIAAGHFAVALPARGDVAVSLLALVSQDAQPGLYRYTFYLVLDDPQGTWTPGQGYGGIIFGDVPSADAPSPIEDFVLDPSSVPVGPWNGLGLASGFHNGPSLTPTVDGALSPVIWSPAFVGDRLTWSGTSAYSNELCDLRFSTLFTTGGAAPAEFALIRCIPEPGPLTLGIIAPLLAVARALVIRRRRSSARPRAPGIASSRQ